MASVCTCGHPFDAHEHVAGFECSPGVTISIDGQTFTGMPDVWVCSGSRPVEITEDTSPWDFVCGCVLHDCPPGGKRDGRRYGARTA